jgi:hypothetical protein
MLWERQQSRPPKIKWLAEKFQAEEEQAEIRGGGQKPSPMDFPYHFQFLQSVQDKKPAKKPCNT